MSRLQLAVDYTSKDEALSLLSRVHDYFDSVEAGTPLIKAEGIGILKKFQKACPKKSIVADMKTADAGRVEAELALSNGADVITVLSTANPKTIKDCLRIAGKKKKAVIVDMINDEVTAGRLKELKSIGVKEVCVHFGIDNPAEWSLFAPKLILVKKFGFALSIAGGINMKNINAVIDYADNIIVGRAVTNSKAPLARSKKLRKLCQK